MADHDNNGGSRNICTVEGLKPIVGMTMVQIVLAVMNILYKLAINNGMSTFVLVAYRYLFAAAFLCPLAFFLERERRPKLTWMVLMQAFGCGLFGGTLGQNMYVASLKMTSATFVSAMINLVPSMTFILAVIFRLEKLSLTTMSGKAKVLGTLLGLIGAMVLTFYKGLDINLWSTNINLLDHGQSNIPKTVHNNSLIGALLAIGSCLSISIWMIVQAKMTNVYPCACSCTALMCFMGAIPSVVVALWFERDMSQWSFGADIRLLTVSYSGIIASGLIISVLAWCIQKKGPLYATIFNPLLLIIVAVLDSLLLNEKLHLGSIIGGVLIIMGLYMVIWGKGREVARVLDSNLPLQSTNYPTEPGRDPLDVLMVVDGITLSRSSRSSSSEAKEERH